MDEKLLLAAIPAFIIAMLLEYTYSIIKNKPVYTLSDTINSISTGLLSIIVNAFVKGLQLFLFVWCYQHWSLFNWSQSGTLGIINWVIFFILTDLVYYWFHRSCHTINGLWAVHEPHHQSDHYNLSTALRQGAFQSLFSTPFYLTLAIIGCPPAWYFSIVALNTLYQFWVHTRFVGKLGWIDKVFVTPSNHRVHHGRNRLYIDKNHGGFFIIWDRLFGTYQEETIPVKYGTSLPLRSWEPISANFAWWRFIWEQAKYADNWMDKVIVWFKPTGWVPPTKQASNKPIVKIHTANVTRARSALFLFSFTVVIGCASFFLFKFSEFSWQEKVLYMMGLMAGLWLIGWRLDKASLKEEKP